MFKRIYRLIRNEDGQALVLLALGLVVLLGFGAIALDYGYLAWQKRNLQNAADSAALAAAWELPVINDDMDELDKIARDYARHHAPELTDTNILSSIDEDDEKIVTVYVEHTYNTFLGRPLAIFLEGDSDSDSQKISASATAEKIVRWAGESLPFMNFDDYTSDVGVWGPDTAPGFFNSLWKNAYEIINENDPNTLYFQVDYENGIQIQNGVDASIKTQVRDIFLQGNDPVYIWSISSDILKGIGVEEAGDVRIVDENGNPIIDKDGKEIIKNIYHTNNSEGKMLDNQDIIHPGDLVLLEVSFDNFDFQGGNDDSLSLTFKREYKINEGEYPENYTGPGSITSRLIK